MYRVIENVEYVQGRNVQGRSDKGAKRPVTTKTVLKLTWYDVYKYKFSQTMYTMALNHDLRPKGHNYQIPNYSTELHKRSFIAHSLFQYY